MTCGDSLCLKGTEPEWRKLVERGVKQKQSWLGLATSNYFTVDDLHILADNFFEALQDPQPPLLKLRRESVSLLSTTLQEMLADANSAEPDEMYLPSLTASTVQKLDDFYCDLLDEVSYMQFDNETKLNQLLIARWNLRKHKAAKLEYQGSYLLTSAASTYVTARSYEDSALDLTYTNFPLKDAESFLLKLYSVIKASVGFHCKHSYQVLKSFGELVEMSSRYVIAVRVIQWNAFCAAVSSIDTDYRAFSLLVNDICNVLHEGTPKNPMFSVMRLMVIQWRRKVFTPLKDSLLQAVLYLLHRQRSHLLNTHNGHKSFCAQSEITGLGAPLTKLQKHAEMTLLCK